MEYGISKNFIEVSKKVFEYTLDCVNYKRIAFSDVIVYREKDLGLDFGIFDDKYNKYYVLETIYNTWKFKYSSL